MKREPKARARFQFVWWWSPWDWGITWFRPFPEGGPNDGSIYKWCLQIGPLEIRRWFHGVRIFVHGKEHKVGGASTTTWRGPPTACDMDADPFIVKYEEGSKDADNDL